MAESVAPAASSEDALNMGDPFESVPVLVDFLVATGYAVRDRRGQATLKDGGIAYLLCRIAVDVQALLSKPA